jgi:transcriptional regulator with XRE-family HTH domain
LNEHDNCTVLAYVAANLKRLRAENQMSQQVLADRSGMSRRMIAALENGSSNISLAKLSLLASVLGVSFTNMVRPPESDDTESKSILTWRGAMPNSEAHLSCSLSNKHQVELWVWQISPNDYYQAEADPEGWFEMIYIIEGTLTLEFASETKTLQTGESITYPSSQHYRYCNTSGQPVRFIRNVVSSD